MGGDVCAARLVREQPDRIRSLLRDLSDTRFGQRVLRFESELSLMPPTAALTSALFEAFGYSRNREQMLRLARAVDWTSFAPRLHRLDRDSRTRLTLAALLGLSGWMPLRPSHASIAHLAPSEVTRLETIWEAEHASWAHAALTGTIWDIARVRPANHPVAHVATLAVLLGGHGTELVPVLLNAIRDKLPLEEILLQIVSGTSAPPLGADRAIAIAASAVLPFAVAYARLYGDDALEDDALRAWGALPAGSPSQSARRARQQVAGDVRITGFRERGAQGLLWLDRHYCGPRRCYECPIARAVVVDELAQPNSSMNTGSSSAC
ncbi:MAG TPA: DUF2851 family protein [Thermomicrobiales bacterium]|nr:DUF2851 family protein [Thermomicrobiales bacterium]